MSKAFSIILLLLSCTTLSGQKIQFGISIDGNFTFLRLTNSSKISNDENLKPFFGYGAGLLGIMKISEIWQLQPSIDFIRTTTTKSMIFTDNYGTPQGINKTYNNNHYLSLSTIASLKIGTKFNLGGGFFLNYLLWSNTYVSNLKNTFIGGAPMNTNRIPNYYYNKIIIGIPLEAKYNLKQIDLVFRFNFGLSNRIKGYDVFVKEYENTICLGVNYVFSGK